MNWEFQILDGIQKIACSGLDHFFAWLSPLFDWGIPWFLLAAILLFRRKTRKEGLCVLLSMIAELVIVSVGIKPLVGRLRPCDLREVALLVPCPGSASFPSGHTAQAFAVSSVLYYSHSKCFVPALILAVVLAFSRLYLYVHFPTDVLAGAMVGWACGWLVAALYRKQQKTL